MITFAGWYYLDTWLYTEKYSNSPMQFIVFLWASVTLIAALQNGPSAALQALKEFRSLALATVYGSVLSVTLVFMALFVYAVEYSIAGILVAELFVTIWVLRVSLSRFRTGIIALPTSSC